MNVPAELKYTKEHEWIRVEGEEAVVGITDYAQSQLGDIVFVECETVGDALEAGETFGTVEAVKTVYRWQGKCSNLMKSSKVNLN